MHSKNFCATSQTQFTDYNLLDFYKLSSKIGFELHLKMKKRSETVYSTVSNLYFQYGKDEPF